MEEEQQGLTMQLSEAQKKLAAEKLKNTDTHNQMMVLRSTIDSTRNELDEYKTKAQRILLSKEKV